MPQALDRILFELEIGIEICPFVPHLLFGAPGLRPENEVSHTKNGATAHSARSKQATLLLVPDNHTNLRIHPEAFRKKRDPTVFSVLTVGWIWNAGRSRYFGVRGRLVDQACIFHDLKTL